MGVIEIDSFDFLADSIGHPEAFIIKGDKLEEEVRYINDNKIRSIYLSFFKSRAIVNLEFLKEISFVEKINLNDLEISYEGLYNLDNLKEAIISVKNRKQFLEYSFFKNLKSLAIDWYPVFPDLSSNLNLKKLKLWKYRPLSKSVKELKHLQHIEILCINQSNIESLEGIGEMTNLFEFEGNHLNKLITLENIELLKTSLRTLTLDYCRKLENYEKSLIHLTKLEKLVLGDCGDLQSLDFISKLNNLNFFSFFGTRLKDGNLQYLINNKIAYTSFTEDSSYSHTKTQILEGLKNI